MPTPEIVSSINAKGGVGKTTFALHLAFRAQELNRKVLVVDLDTQGNAGTGLTGDISLPFERTDHGAEVLFTCSEPDQIRPRKVSDGIDLLVGHRELDAYGKVENLKDADKQRDLLRALPYDLVLIDTPPTMSARQIAALLWSDRVLIPVAPATFSLQGLAQTRELIHLAQERRPDLDYLILVNLVRRVSKSQNLRLENLRQLDLPIFPTFFSQREAIVEALDNNLPVWRFRTAKGELKRTWQGAMTQILHWQGTTPTPLPS